MVCWKQLLRIRYCNEQWHYGAVERRGNQKIVGPNHFILFCVPGKPPSLPLCVCVWIEYFPYHRLRRMRMSRSTPVIIFPHSVFVQPMEDPRSVARFHSFQHDSPTIPRLSGPAPRTCSLRSHKRSGELHKRRIDANPKSCSSASVSSSPNIPYYSILSFLTLSFLSSFPRAQICNTYSCNCTRKTFLLFAKD
jgi:hypothetical protein